MKEIQTSETLKIGILLALSGGFMDAYSYICRGGVFANAQTGNMLLLGVNLSSGQWHMAARYALPVFAFAMGIAIAEFIRFGMVDKNLLHWRQITVFLEPAADSRTAPAPRIITCSRASEVATVTECFCPIRWTVFSIYWSAVSASLVYTT